jgi:hypothetical protein
MRIKLTYIGPLLAAAAAAVAIAAAYLSVALIPTAMGTGSSPVQALMFHHGDYVAQPCSGNICQSPGNVQINNAPPPVQYHPYGDMPFLLGGHGGLRGGMF